MKYRVPERSRKPVLDFRTEIALWCFGLLIGAAIGVYVALTRILQ
jgi:hypothetical protein